MLFFRRVTYFSIRLTFFILNKSIDDIIYIFPCENKKRLVVFRIYMYVDLAVFQPYRDLEAEDNQSLKSLRRDQLSNPGPLKIISWKFKIILIQNPRITHHTR